MHLASKSTELFELGLLWEVSKILGGKQTPLVMYDSIKSVFKAFLDTEKFEILIFDENNQTFKNFVRSWDVISDNDLIQDYTKILNLFSKGFEQSFVLNYELISLFYGEVQLLNQVNDCINCNTDKIFLPLAQGNKLIGLIEIEFKNLDKKILSYNLLLSLNIVATQISSEIVTLNLNEQMYINMSFYETMKDIAKIIETQYELSYVIPLIGEMIDKFIYEHLIYVFSYKDEDYKLLWPKSYSKERLDSILNDGQIGDTAFLSDDGKVGVFPLVSENNLLGAIVADSRVAKLSDKEFLYLEQLSQQASITISKANTYAEVLQHATMDALTGLHNRRQLETRLRQEISVAKRKKTSLCCMMLDIDYFKKINDTYGHAVGDFVLQHFAQVIKQGLREYDFPARYGGEEFCIVLPGTPIEEALLVAQRLREKVEQTSFDLTGFNFDGVKDLSITVSIGISEYTDTMQDYSQLHKNADMALYQAKRNGRNRVEV